MWKANFTQMILASWGRQIHVTSGFQIVFNWMDVSIFDSYDVFGLDAESF